MFERLTLITKEEGLSKLKDSSVLVLGLGGVGGHCCEALARSGVGTLIIVDRDIVDVTNINRQIVALHSTIGKVKTDIMKERILDINPDCRVIAYHTFYNHDTKEEILSNKIDFICDCIDTITFKIDIIKQAITRNIPIISSMGAGNKVHPELLEIEYLHKTSYDPIAKVIRTKLRKEQIDAKIPVVYSKEEPIETNTTVIGSTSFTPSVAGLLMAGYVVRKIIE
jgi:tRNA A37 threonylcarbamoyladenosine dehydratase